MYSDMAWYDTNNSILFIRNEANSDWIPVLRINQTTKQVELFHDTKVVDGAGNTRGVLATHTIANWRAGVSDEPRLIAPNALIEVQGLRTTTVLDPDAGDGQVAFYVGDIFQMEGETWVTGDTIDMPSPITISTDDFIMYAPDGTLLFFDFVNARTSRRYTSSGGGWSEPVDITFPSGVSFNGRDGLTYDRDDNLVLFDNTRKQKYSSTDNGSTWDTGQPILFPNNLTPDTNDYLSVNIKNNFVYFETATGGVNTNVFTSQVGSSWTGTGVKTPPSGITFSSDGSMSYDGDGNLVYFQRVASNRYQRHVQSIVNLAYPEQRGVVYKTPAGWRNFSEVI